MSTTALPLTLTPQGTLGSLEVEQQPAPIPGAVWYTAHQVGDALTYFFPVGSLAGAGYLSADMLIDGNHLVVFTLTLQEREDGPTFQLLYSALNQCSARMRMALEAVNQNRWQYPREGAWLKPMCGGQRVDLARVDRMAITVVRKSDRPARWCITPVTASVEAPPELEELVLPKGPLLDAMGQSTLHEWPAKSRSHDEATARLQGQLRAAPSQSWPDSYSRFGGWRERRLEGTGFFRTAQEGGRWWLVDPEGYLFWSSGMDCVTVDCQSAYQGLETALTWLPPREGNYAPARHEGSAGRSPTVNYLAANFIRAFGPEDYYRSWAQIALAELRRYGTNTVANWSDYRIAQAAGFPYVRPLHPHFERTACVYRDFPDVFEPSFQEEAEAYAQQLRDTADDPAFIGYFLMNEPTWGFAGESPAAGMLFTARPGCAARRALAEFLRERHGSDGALSAAWNLSVSLSAVANGEWTTPLTDAARADLDDFSEVMTTRLFRGLSDACRRVDPNHLNLGARYYTVPPAWALEGMRCFDVFSMNCYEERVRAGEMRTISQLLGMPVMVGEWHFGALDVGLPGSGIGHVRDQRARGQAYRIYVEDAATQPECVGVHYFTLYDESALGRFDGENWNIGFMDVCNRPYEPLAEAARATHERLYPVAGSQTPAFDDAPEYLPKLFL